MTIRETDWCKAPSWASATFRYMDLSWVPPVATLVLGIIGTLVVERLRDGRTEMRETAQRAAAREGASRDRRERFELDTLQAAYEASNALGRAAFQYHFLDRDVAKKLNVKYASRQLGSIPGEAELGEALRLANLTASSHASMILDKEIRERLRFAINVTMKVGHGEKTVAEADRMMDDAASFLGAAQEEIAERIRAIYLETGSTPRSV